MLTQLRNAPCQGTLKVIYHIVLTESSKVNLSPSASQHEAWQSDGSHMVDENPFQKAPDHPSEECTEEKDVGPRAWAPTWPKQDSTRAQHGHVPAEHDGIELCDETLIIARWNLTFNVINVHKEISHAPE